MLHTYSQRQQLQTARQELSHALYQHDAACRVIARLNKEVAAAREALATLKPQAGILAAAGGTQQAMDIDTTTYTTQPIEQTGMTAEIIEKLQEKATVLTEERRNRGRTVPRDLVTADQIRNFSMLASHPVSCWKIFTSNVYHYFIKFSSHVRVYFYRDYIQPVYRAYWHLIYAVLMRIKY